MILQKKLPFGFMLSEAWVELTFVIIVGLGVHYFKTTYAHLIPEMPLAIPAFIGTAISVLLSFKMSQSYDRWWEARKIWGAIVNDSRSLVLQLQSFIPAEKSTIRRMAYRQIAWCYALGRSLRGLEILEGLELLLPAAELDHLPVVSNKPLGILQGHVSDIAELQEQGHLDVFRHVQLNETIIRFTDSMGKAERIKFTVFPTLYRIFLHFTIYLFVVLLSIALTDVATIFEIPLLVVISLVFFLLEKTATQLQDPFENRPSDVSVTAISRTIEINLRQLIGETAVPPPAAPVRFYLM